MKIIRSVRQMQEYAAHIKRQGSKIGLVPTMGYLHQGHISLVRQAVKDNDIAVISIFVNSIQFGPEEDFKRYPRDFKRDCLLAKSSGAGIIFYPPKEAMYPDGYQTYVEVEKLSGYLCGRSRPGHFKGVATVVAKLFNIITPDTAYFGQKDAQQAIVIKRMVKDLNMDIVVKIMPTVRGPDGLAMSSRNSYLSPAQRKDALVLKNALQKAKSMISSDEIAVREIISRMRQIIQDVSAAKIDYISIVDAETLEDLRVIKGNVLIMLAVKIGDVRLIDNIVVRR